MKAYGALDVYIQIFLTSALVGGEGPASRSDRFFTRKEPLVSNGYEARLAPEPGLDGLEKRKFLTLPGLEL
jgi:hypothetical protein